MSNHPVPGNPSLENLKKRAKRLCDAVRAGDAEASARVRELHPRAEAVLSAFRLADAQLVIARGHGFASWPKLVRHFDAFAHYFWDPPAATGGDGVDVFLRLACLDYDQWYPSHAERARRMLADDPSLSRASLHAAAAVGDVDAAREWLASDRSGVSARGGPLRWEPLLYACYSRLDSADGAHSTLDVARLLLDHGADPNVGFLWRGNVPPFTALTGAFGEGENGNNQPPHRDCEALATLLLERGADPNDGQTLYNRHFRPDDAHLRLLLAHGLGRDRGGPWYERLGERLQSPKRMLIEELWAAARKGFRGRVALLVEHGADVNGRGVRDGRSIHESALLGGNREIAEYLRVHGARPESVDPRMDFAAACMSGDEAAVRAMLAGDPGLLERIDAAHRAKMVQAAVEARHAAGVRLLAKLGFDLSTLTRNTPLHDAAWGGDLEMVRLLIELGADPRVRDRSYGSTPIGWAAHNHQGEVVAYLASFAELPDAVAVGAVERVEELLEADPDRARGASFVVGPSTPRRDEVVAALRARGADVRDGEPA